MVLYARKYSNSMQYLLLTLSLKEQFCQKMKKKSVCTMFIATNTRCMRKNIEEIAETRERPLHTKRVHLIFNKSTILQVNRCSGSVISFPKHTPQGFTSFISSWGISWVNSKTFHLLFIILVSLTINEPTLLDTISSAAVANTGLSLVKLFSLE